jgi:hypothetical protein
VAGGHAITIIGFDGKISLIKFANDWGTEWGQKCFGSMDIETARMIVTWKPMFAVDLPPKIDIST